MFVDALRDACVQRGMQPADADASIGQYLLVGTMSARDRLFLDGLVDAGMTGQAILHCRVRFGPAAAPAAWTAYQANIGGREPQQRPGHGEGVASCRS